MPSREIGSEMTDQDTTTVRVRQSGLLNHVAQRIAEGAEGVARHYLVGIPGMNCAGKSSLAKGLEQQSFGLPGPTRRFDIEQQSFGLPVGLQGGSRDIDDFLHESTMIRLAGSDDRSQADVVPVAQHCSI